MPVPAEQMRINTETGIALEDEHLRLNHGNGRTRQPLQKIWQSN